MALRCRAFGMEVSAYDPYISKEKADRAGAQLLDDLAGALSLADVVTLHVPLTAETRRLLDSRLLKACKRGAFLVNCARGGLMEDHLLRGDAVHRAGFDAQIAADAQIRINAQQIIVLRTSGPLKALPASFGIAVHRRNFDDALRHRTGGDAHVAIDATPVINFKKILALIAADGLRHGLLPREPLLHFGIRLVWSERRQRHVLPGDRIHFPRATGRRHNGADPDIIADAPRAHEELVHRADDALGMTDGINQRSGPRGHIAGQKNRRLR